MRNLSLDFADRLFSPLRQPAYKIYAWDPDTTTMSEVVTGATTIATALDLTPYVGQVSWTPTTLKLAMHASSDIFHPDFGSARLYLRDRSIIRLFEGDETIPFADWIITFTGQIHGQIGWRINRKDKLLSTDLTVFDRGQTKAFKRRKITSKEYTVGTDLGVALYDISDTFMDLTAPEIRIPAVIGRQFYHRTNQIVQLPPWEAIQAILQVICYDPYFDGEGKLTAVNHNLARMPDLVLSDGTIIVENAVPERSGDTINKIIMTFLDALLERVDSQFQMLGSAEVTTGFFSMGEKLKCRWSEDSRQRASGTTMIVKKSVNSGLLPVGTESYEQDDEYSGTITVEISVWVPILATVMIAEYIAAAWVPDGTKSTSKNTLPIVLTNGMGLQGGHMLTSSVGGGPVFGEITINPAAISSTEVPGTGWTIPWGRVAQAQALTVILLLMMSIGSAQYEIWGVPYDYAYLEKQTIALEDGLDYWDENEKEIKNDFIGSFDQADVVAMTELTWEKSKSQPRKITIVDDPRLELGDIIVLPDRRKLVITALSKTIARGQIPQLTIEGCKASTAS